MLQSDYMRALCVADKLGLAFGIYQNEDSICHAQPLEGARSGELPLRVAVCCSVLQCVAVCYRVVQCVAVWCSVVQCVAVCCSVMQCIAVYCSVVHCVVVCCSVSYCDAE